MDVHNTFLPGLFALLVIIQFFHPAKNVSERISENDISQVYQVPAKVSTILVSKCYDCYSNNTHYPWYNNIQPVAWWMSNHVKGGKRHLNFSEFKTYSEKKAKHKLEELSESVTEGWMPPDSYLWIHKEARITSEDAAIINLWIASLGVKTSRSK